jgi:hypothetical protein
MAYVPSRQTRPSVVPLKVRAVLLSKGLATAIVGRCTVQNVSVDEVTRRHKHEMLIAGSRDEQPSRAHPLCNNTRAGGWVGAHVKELQVVTACILQKQAQTHLGVQHSVPVQVRVGVFHTASVVGGFDYEPSVKHVVWLEHHSEPGTQFSRGCGW